MQDKSIRPSPGRILTEIVTAATEHLKSLGYRSNSVRHFARTWQQLVQFADDKGCYTLTLELTEAFLLALGPRMHDGALSAACQRQKRNAMRVLIEFQRWGYFTRRMYKSNPILPPAVFDLWFKGYLEFCVEHFGAASRTMRGRRRNVVHFLKYLEANGVDDLGQMAARHIGDFMASRIHLQPKTLAILASDVRGFLRYLVMNGIVDARLVKRVPKIRIAADERIPDVWTKDEVERLLAAVDRGSPIGKRNYAILLLAARLGMRAGDIRDLRLDNIRWDVACIEKQQCKTGAPLLLPFGEEIGTALIDYLQHGRPQSSLRVLFLRSNAPFEPFGSNNNLHYIITNYRRRAGIVLPGRRRRGLHSLRHTTATRLLESGASMETIASVMGHASWESTLVYTKVDIPALQRVALDPEVMSHE